ncbi:MAG: hypothetical protein PWQ79_2091 [Thermococcaceae archaeon]|nr:hypothetical protein [Thermococcaceae archaeon]
MKLRRWLYYISVLTAAFSLAIPFLATSIRGLLEVLGEGSLLKVSFMVISSWVLAYMLFDEEAGDSELSEKS